MQLLQELLNVGLTDKEAEVYTSALQLGYCSVQEISFKSGLNRTTTYTHIKNLINRGLLNAVERYGKVCYVAERPEKLKFIYEQKEKEIQRRRETLEQIMPELESIYCLAKDKPSVRYHTYENKEELARVRQEIQNCRTDEMCNIFNYNIIKDYISPMHIKNLLENVNRFKVLYISKNNILDTKLHRFLNNEKFKLKFLPESKFGFLCEILIMDDKVYIAGKGDWLIIKDKLFSQTLGLVFQALWGIAGNNLEFKI